MPPFLERLQRIQDAKSSRLCVGLDPDPDRLPRHLTDGRALPTAILRFNHAIIEATADKACAFKLNFAFYEALGREGWGVLDQTIRRIPEDALVIADAKRGDIGNTARMYAKAIFETLGCDGCTVSPYMGKDSIFPFLQYKDCAVFVLARTSNAGSEVFQECECDNEPLYLSVGRRVAEWQHGQPGSAGLVVGATAVGALSALRERCPALPFLIPGVGAQGGAPEAAVAAATERGPVIVNSSRSIIYASGEEDFAEAAGRSADALRRQLAG